MNIKSYLKAAVVALPLAIGGGKAAAQTPKQVAKLTERVVAADTLKAMEQKSNDVPTVLLKKYKGHYSGSIENGKIGNGTLTYKERGENVPVHNILTPASSVKIDGSFVSAKNLPGTGYRLNATFQKADDAFSATGIYSHGGKERDIIGDLSYTRMFPLSKDFSAKGGVGVEGTLVHHPKNNDSYGQILPHISTGVDYAHTFDSGVKVGAKTEIGGALPMNYKRNKSVSTVQSPKVTANAEVEAGYKNITGFVAGGKDAAMGANIGGGVRVNF
jgi:hypothetical protein